MFLSFADNIDNIFARLDAKALSRFVRVDRREQVLGIKKEKRKNEESSKGKKKKGKGS